MPSTNPTKNTGPRPPAGRSRSARPPAGRSRSARARAAEAAERRRRNQYIVAAVASTVVVLLIAVLVVVKVTSSGSTNSGTPANAAAPPSVIAQLAAIPPSTLAQAAASTKVTNGPKPITAPPLTEGSKPLVFYYGAEYCPYCAAERWPMVTALLQFGQFTGLAATHSAANDVNPNTATFSFSGSSYSSQYVAFNGVETQTNTGAPLDTPTAAQQQIVQTYDNVPYVSSSAVGTIPFIDFGGKYLQSGASYDGTLLQGKDMAQISAAVADPTSKIGQQVLASAGLITEDICQLTGNQPAAVCSAFPGH
ncbi:MAG: DUF929 family protein [Acidimicrobiales bacterium]